MTHLVRFATPDRPGARVGLRTADGAISALPVPTLAELWHLRLAELRTACAPDRATPVDEPVTLLPPLDGRTEVWASGVTYARSRDARVDESGAADVYERVYDAARPELFLKSVAWRVVTSGEPIGVREDGVSTVPEPEVAVVVNRYGEIVGVTVCDDVTARGIEGENPLYLPQAKTYAGSCALAAGITPVWEVPDLHDLPIRASITRGGVAVWSAGTSTAALHRRIPDLVDWLYRADHHPDGAVLSTGTGIVPGPDVTLEAGDTVTVEVEGVGTLVNPVTVGAAAFTVLAGGGRPGAACSSRTDVDQEPAPVVT